MVLLFIAALCTIIYVFIVLVSLIGFLEIAFKFNSKHRASLESNIKDSDLVGVTILRPLKGIDPEMETCLESSFLQNYPKDRLEIIFCVQDPHDPAIDVVQRLIARFPRVDAKLMLDQEGAMDNYGPNPKINNLAKGYKAAKFDTLWVIDSNVWARPDTLRRSVYTMVHNLHDGSKVCGTRTVGLVNHVPLALAMKGSSAGSRLDEMFLSTSHAKFYVALNTVAIAPCVNGKSNIYRRSDLDASVELASGIDNEADSRTFSGKPFNESPDHSPSITYFARYIGEDNMIATALWDHVGARSGMSLDAVIQPLGGTSPLQNNTIADYVSRRVRWLRARKYMVLAATLVEPTTECLVCGIIGTFGLSVLLWGSRFNLLFFTCHVLTWFLIDYTQYHILSECIRSGLYSVPDFLDSKGKSLSEFIPIWITREVLAFPIWAIAMAGSEIDWRGQPFRINADLTAERL
ncbi:DEKNAAC105368 [Brettanomyces naardenensis]|uniref:Ceramide glucosyltransferase n=1 Tax=Brettanomyces naardenensis TaxID=13370 RepID=A0A448YT78_BRENA|nr:DEKNAAC105368 [Brettanomyces naardenensis]